MALLSLGALGVVYGDVGTSPLYAIRECLSPSPERPHAVAADIANVYGVLSLIVWALILVVAIKYLVFILRADNKGEGGILALLALVSPARGEKPRRGLLVLMMLGLFGAGLLYGESVITPVISVLGAIEGIQVRWPGLQPLIVPITIGILVGLFVVQRFGTGSIGRAFGIMMLVWFTAIAVLGARAIAGHPEVLQALSPHWGVKFFINNGVHGFLLLGSVVLAVTGAEALYADMGHFGRTPIRLAWFTIVMPALLLNYFGQGANMLGDRSAAENPFYALAPGWTLYPMLFVATSAAIIASQALISGIFSLTRQAMQLGYWPRARVIHTSAQEEGQIYIPEMNYLLMTGSIALTLAYGSASAIAAAYGMAVTGTMVITSLLFWVVARRFLGWSTFASTLLVIGFLCVDVAFFAANVTKIGSGGWFPLAGGALVFTLMTTWRKGRELLGERIAEDVLPLEVFVADVEMTKPHRVKGTAVFMTGTTSGTPPALLHYFKHMKVLHEEIVLLTIVPAQVPKVELKEQVEVEEKADGLWLVRARVGFMQDPNVPLIMRRAKKEGLAVDLNDVTYYLGRETLLTGRRKGMATWRKVLFAFMSRNSRPATQFFHLPPNRVVELGAQIEL